MFGLGPDGGNSGAAMEKEMKDKLKKTPGVAIHKSKRLRAHNDYKFQIPTKTMY